MGREGLIRGADHPESALTPAFVRNVARAGRYCDGRCESRVSDS